ncbi:hypothetical protein [Acidovorax sp. BLS4]|uniref:hypothetical protein n=1 Tax=Acidovorax sp. BLS4 TaxID=3273430 RepID=UPI002942513A|nr:hypothetical protein [Paracidovorax avenae]WOI47100.1 hypothetical protein R1Z03_07760 [Paracidovorax avenae]
MNKRSEAEPFFITEEVEAEMRASGYVFEPPTHVSTHRLREILTGLPDADLAAWPDEIARQERAQRSGNRA